MLSEELLSESRKASLFLPEDQIRNHGRKNIKSDIIPTQTIENSKMKIIKAVNNINGPDFMLSYIPNETKNKIAEYTDYIKYLLDLRVNRNSLFIIYLLGEYDEGIDKNNE